jgi:cysteine-rich repeat protein
MQPMGTADYPAETEQNDLKSTADVLGPATKGFTAAIWPQGDIDIFTFDITVPESTVAIKTSDGMGGCPAGAKTFLRVFDANGGVLATDAGAAGCADLTPANTASLASLSPGKYYVRVESANLSAIPLYVIDIKVSSPGCGDGIPQLPSGEQCDDGNSASGDGCSATCQIESGTYLDELEPNDAQATGNLLDGYAGAVAAINPMADVDWYTFNITVPGSSVTAEVGDALVGTPNGGCPGNFDSKIYLYDAQQTLLASDDDNGAGSCSKIWPGGMAAASNLPAGLYAIKVEEFGNDKAQDYYVLKLKVSPPGCGDGVVQLGEQCDDSNAVSGDGCSATCQFEQSYVTETEPNDTQSAANPLPAAVDGFIASINPIGDNDYFSFDVTVPNSTVTIRTSDGASACPVGFDSELSLYDPQMTQIAHNDDANSSTKCSLIAPSTAMGATNLAVGTYAVRVNRYSNNGTQAQYVVSIKVNPPGCGDGVKQAGEQCDDNNDVAGDGCSPTCMAEAPYEIEPNNTYLTATPPWPSFSTWKGSISPVGDRDYYQFTLATVASPTLVTHDPDSPTTCGFDTVIHLLDGNGMQIVQDDEGGPGGCSKIDPTTHPQVKDLPAGTYYVWVQRYNDSMTIPLYQLDLTIQ